MLAPEYIKRVTSPASIINKRVDKLSSQPSKPLFYLMSSSPHKLVTYSKKSNSRRVAARDDPEYSSAKLPSHGQNSGRRISKHSIQTLGNVEKTWAPPPDSTMASTVSEALRSDKSLLTLAPDQTTAVQISESGTSKSVLGTTGRLFSSAPSGKTGDTSKKHQTGITSRTLKENMGLKARPHERSNVFLIN